MMETAKIFCDGAVFQAGKPIRIFGTGDGEAEVSFDGECRRARSENGKWQIELGARAYGGPHELKLNLNGQEKTLRDIYIGEVVLLVGQSNIALKLKRSTYPVESYEGEPLVRYFVSKRYENEDTFSPDDGWVKCTEESAANFSAIGYHIGISACREKNIAVGLIACYLGSSVIESWMPAEISCREEFYLPPEEKYDSPYVHGAYNVPGTLYGIRQQSIVPFAVGHVVWYQGESNSGAGEWKIYTKLLFELISCWRRDFVDPELPFYVVLLPNFDERNDAAWNGIRTAQEKIIYLTDHVFTVPSADVCESFDIHPPTKVRLAERIWQRIKENIEA